MDWWLDEIIQLVIDLDESGIHQTGMASECYRRHQDLPLLIRGLLRTVCLERSSQASLHERISVLLVGKIRIMAAMTIRLIGYLILFDYIAILAI